MSATTLTAPPPAARPLVARVRRAVRARPALSVALAVLVVVFAGLLATHRAPRLAVPAGRARALAYADPGVRALLRSLGSRRLVVMALDNHWDQVFAYRGDQAVFTADVSVHGLVGGASKLVGPGSAFGSATAHTPLVLALLATVFVLMTAVWPLWRLRNLDVLVAVGLVAAVVLFEDMEIKWTVLSAYPALTYLALRAAWCALARPRSPAPAVALFDRLTAGWTVCARRRILRLSAVAAGLIVAVVGFTSLHLIDVSYAVMEGATLIVHGVLPYAHMPDILHSDTYPIGTYLFYAPIALHWPVYDAWGDADPTLVVAAGSALAAAWMLARCGRRAGRGRWAGGRSTGADAAPAPSGAGTGGVAGPSAGAGAGRATADELAGLRAAIAWLMFPCLLVTVSTGTTDVALGAMVLGSLLLWRRPAAASAALAASAWFKLSPLALLPLSLARLRGRRLAWALAAVGLVCLVMGAVLLALGGTGAVGAMLRGMSFQQTRVSPHSLWAWVGSVPLQQLAEAATCALIAGGALRLRRDRQLAADRWRIAALFASILLGLQISANYWSYMYTLWVVPVLCLALWGPVLDEHAPA